jgi:Domain of unknown function (DUF4436)
MSARAATIGCLTNVSTATVGAVDRPSDKPAADEDSKEFSPARLSPLLRRSLTLVALLVGCAVAYGVILAQFDLSKDPGEAELGAPASDARVKLYLQAIQIDAVNESMQVRISVVPLSEATATIADRDFLLTVQRGKQVEHVQIRANQPLPEVTFDFDLHGGDVRDYPLDRYVSLMTLAASERAQDGLERSLPIHVTAWEGVLGFHIEAQSAATPRPDELQLQFAVSRTGAVAFFGIAIYGAMIVMMLCALIIGTLVFVGVRRIEVTLVGALGAMIFALPAVRNALPGSPPLGVRADILIFFWAELGAIIALCLFITAWTRQGARP